MSAEDTTILTVLTPEQLQQIKDSVEEKRQTIATLRRQLAETLQETQDAKEARNRAAMVERQKWMPEVERLKAENAQLRAALNAITRLTWGYDGDCGAVQIAEAALQPSAAPGTRESAGSVPAESLSRDCPKCGGGGSVEIQSGPYEQTCEACGGTGKMAKLDPSPKTP